MGGRASSPGKTGEPYPPDPQPCPELVELARQGQGRTGPISNQNSGLRLFISSPGKILVHTKPQPLPSPTQLHLQTDRAGREAVESTTLFSPRVLPLTALVLLLTGPLSLAKGKDYGRQGQAEAMLFPTSPTHWQQGSLQLGLVGHLPQSVSSQGGQ